MEHSEILIRLGTKEDLPDVHKLVYELAVYEKAPEELVATVADYHRDFEAGIFETLVAEAGGDVVGMALYYMTYSTWKGRMLYLEDFVVQEPHRRRGIGRQLFEAFLNRAREKECRLAKWQVLDWNEPALDFYRKFDAAIETNWWNGKIFFELC